MGAYHVIDGSGGVADKLARAQIRVRSLPNGRLAIAPRARSTRRSRSGTRGGAVMRVLELPAGGTPREWGRIHGESFRGEIRALAEIRAYLCTRVGGFKTREQVMAAARAHLPVLERYDAALYAELSRHRRRRCVHAGGDRRRESLHRPARPRSGSEHVAAGADARRSDGIGLGLGLGLARRRWLQRDLGRDAERTHPRADVGHARDRDPVRDGARHPRIRCGPGGAPAHRHRLPRDGRDERGARRHRDQQSLLDRRDGSASCGPRWFARRCSSAARSPHAT